MFFDFPVISIGAVCSETADVVNILLSQLLQFFGFSAVTWADTFCSIINFGEFPIPFLS